MKIESAKLIICSPDRNFVTLKIQTSDGIYGLGDATLNGREMAVAAYLNDHVLPCLIGRDPFDIEDIWQYLYRGAYWRRGPITMTAISAVDVALWDIKAKALKTPLYNLLGGKSRQGVLVYAHANGRDIAEAVDSVQKHMDMGYLAIRAQSGVPGVEGTYGVPKGEKSYEPAERGLPIESLWSTERYLTFIPKLFEAIRKSCGEDIQLLHDVHHRLTQIEAVRLGRSLEPFHLFWMEDPTPAETQEAFRIIREGTVTPIATGEVFNSFWDAHDLIRNQWIDYLRMTIVHGGGITALKKAADFAAVYQVRTGFHGATDLSPVTMAAALHFGLAIHNFGIQEAVQFNQATQDVFPGLPTMKNGYMYVNEAPGWGVDLNEDLAKKFPLPETPGYWLPTRRKDGTTVRP